jgi:malate dehydrogenase
MFGPDQPPRLHLIEIPTVLGALEGVVMELDDCAFPLLESVRPPADLDEGFHDVDWALLVGSIPRKAGMERKGFARDQWQDFHRTRLGDPKKCGG